MDKVKKVLTDILDFIISVIVFIGSIAGIATFLKDYINLPNSICIILAFLCFGRFVLKLNTTKD